MASFTLTVNGSRLDVNDPDCNTLAEAIAIFRDSQNIPENATALLNGEPFDDFDADIEDGSEVSLNRPLGQKG